MENFFNLRFGEVGNGLDLRYGKPASFLCPDKENLCPNVGC
jgi:hypothetical protein